MTYVLIPEGDESIKLKYKDNGDGSYTPVIESNDSSTVISIPVKYNTAQPTCTPILTVASGYVTGYYVGTSATPMVFSGCSISGYGGYFISAEFVNGNAGTTAVELWLFDSQITPPNDSSAWSISDADAQKLIAVVPFSTFYASALNTVSFGSPDGGATRFVSSNGNLYGCLVTRGTPTYASQSLTVRLTTIPD